jgi:hypothetical protein
LRNTAAFSRDVIDTQIEIQVESKMEELQSKHIETNDLRADMKSAQGKITHLEAERARTQNRRDLKQ